MWRIECRAGRDALSRFIKPPLTRTYANVEALLPTFLQTALSEVRYVTNRDQVSNVTRSEVHPMWLQAQSIVENLPEPPEPPLTPEYVIEFMRKQRHAMALAQGFGNLNNMLILEGRTADEIRQDYPALCMEKAAEYVETVGTDRHAKKLRQIAERQSVFLGPKV